MLMIAAAAALAGCGTSSVSTTSQDTPPVAMQDFSRPAYDYSNSAMPVPAAAPSANDATAHASGHE